jgi:hypothetical protein
MTTPPDLVEIANALRTLASLLDAYSYPTQPTQPPPPQPPPPTPVLGWDTRLTARGVAVRQAGDLHTLIYAAYLPPGNTPDTAQGKHHILIDVQDRFGNRVVGAKFAVSWADGRAEYTIEEKPNDEYGGNFAMDASGWGYTLEFADWQIAGMGLGTIDEPNVGHHTSFAFVFKER